MHVLITSTAVVEHYGSDLTKEGLKTRYARVIKPDVKLLAGAVRSGVDAKSVVLGCDGKIHITFPSCIPIFFSSSEDSKHLHKNCGICEICSEDFNKCAITSSQSSNSSKMQKQMDACHRNLSSARVKLSKVSYSERCPLPFHHLEIAALESVHSLRLQKLPNSMVMAPTRRPSRISFTTTIIPRSRRSRMTLPTDESQQSLAVRVRTMAFLLFRHSRILFGHSHLDLTFH